MTTDDEIDQVDEGINQQLTRAKEDIQAELQRIEEEARKAIEEKEKAEEEKNGADQTKDTTEITVQNGEKIEEIAQKFNCTVEEIKALNSDQIKTSKKGVEYFLAGAKIKVPGKIDNDDDRIKDRKSSEEAEAEWTEEYEQKRAAYLASPEYQKKLQKEKQYKEMGLINHEGQGEKITGRKKSKDNANFVSEEYTVIGKAINGRTLAKDSNGKIVAISHDGIVLKEQFVKDNVTFNNAKAQGKVVTNKNGEEFVVISNRNDGHGRMVVIDSHGQRQILSGGQSKTDLKDRVFLNKGYVEASDKVDNGECENTKTGAEGIKYAKDAQGRVWYFDTNRKGAQGISGQERKELIQKETQYITDKLIEAANYWAGTDDPLLKEAIEDIYSKEILENVNRQLMQRDDDYIPEAGSAYNAVETLVEDEEGHDTLRESVRILASNGAYGTKAETDEKIVNIVKHELQYEVHGGKFGITRQTDLNDIMSMVTNRDQRIALEAKIKHDESFNANGVIDYIQKDDRGFDWSESDLAMFESNWVETGAYAEGTDQKDRNRIRTTLFNADEKDAQLRAFEITNEDENSDDYKNLNELCEKDNQEKGYNKQFKNQNAVQQNIAGRTNLNIGKIDVYNRKLYKNGEPVEISAQRALYNARQGNFTEIFNDRDGEVYAILNDMIQDGEIEGCKSLQDLYKQAYDNTENSNDKAKIKANAIINGIEQINDDELVDFCIELLHSIDSNRGYGASTGISAEHTNKADEQLNQFKAIIQQQGPEFIKKLEAKLKTENFEYSYNITRSSGTTTSSQSYTVNTKEEYKKIVSETYHINPGEGKFYDKDNNLITDPQQIAEIKNRNKSTLKEIRSMVAQLKQMYQTGVDKEGWTSDFTNDVITFGGFATDRGDQVDINFSDFEAKFNAMNDGDSFIIGREATGLNDIIINNDFVSAQHLKVEKINGEIYITDLSRNGTTLNTTKPDYAAKYSPDLQNKFANANYGHFYNMIEDNYTNLRRANYTVEESIGNITDADLQDTSRVDIYNSSGRNFRSAKSRPSFDVSNVADRISLNIVADKNLLAELDMLCATGTYVNTNGQTVQINMPICTYKTPETLQGFTTRHDPITMYFEQEVSDDVLNAVADIASRYERKSCNGKSLMNALEGKPYIAHEAYTSPTEAQNLWYLARELNPSLGDAVYAELNSEGDWNCSTGIFAACKKLVDEYKLSMYMN